MSRTLFIGDSHASGYYEADGKVNFWKDNNYAEVYSEIHKKPVVIYCQPGGTWLKYPQWIRWCLDRYDDIDEVWVQSTYWNRWVMGAVRDATEGEDITTDTFVDHTSPKTDSIHRYTDHRISEDSKYVETVEQVRPSLMEEFKGLTFEDNKITDQWEPFHEKYTYSKLWYELATHIQYRNFCLNYYAIDNMLSKRKIKWFLWTINNRQFMPKNINYYGKLENVTKADMSAERWFSTKKNMEIERMTIDGEHYDRKIHETIAKEYFPYVRKLSLTKF